MRLQHWLKCQMRWWRAKFNLWASSATAQGVVQEVVEALQKDEAEHTPRGGKEERGKNGAVSFQSFPFFYSPPLPPTISRPCPVIAILVSLSPSFRQAIKNGSFFVPFAPSLWAQGSNIGGPRSSQRIACMHPNKIFFFGGRGKDPSADWTSKGRGEFFFSFKFFYGFPNVFNQKIVCSKQDIAFLPFVVSVWSFKEHKRKIQFQFSLFFKNTKNTKKETK